MPQKFELSEKNSKDIFAISAAFCNSAEPLSSSSRLLNLIISCSGKEDLNLLYLWKDNVKHRLEGRYIIYAKQQEVILLVKDQHILFLIKSQSVPHVKIYLAFALWFPEYFKELGTKVENLNDAED